MQRTGWKGPQCLIKVPKETRNGKRGSEANIQRDHNWKCLGIGGIHEFPTQEVYPIYAYHNQTQDSKGKDKI